MKRVSILIVVLALALLVAPQASATLYTLTDGNSTAAIDPTSDAGMYGWSVDGTNVLYQQWFWYRIGSASTTQEYSIDHLGLFSATQNDASDLTLVYGQPAGLSITVKYGLTGGADGSFASDISEVIAVKNATNAPIDFHFFQYSDFDLNRLNLADTVKIDPSLKFVDQEPMGHGPVLSETVITPAPSHAEANYYANTLSKLEDGSKTTLDDVLTAGPGDVTWAFQWDKTLAARNGSLIISKDKSLRPVPEPAPLAMLGGILVVLARKLRTWTA
jgi:hypothetical protein